MTYRSTFVILIISMLMTGCGSEDPEIVVFDSNTVVFEELCDVPNNSSKFEYISSKIPGSINSYHSISRRTLDGEFYISITFHFLGASESFDEVFIKSYLSPDLKVRNRNNFAIEIEIRNLEEMFYNIKNVNQITSQSLGYLNLTDIEIDILSVDYENGRMCRSDFNVADMRLKVNGELLSDIGSRLILNNVVFDTQLSYNVN